MLLPHRSLRPCLLFKKSLFSLLLEWIISIDLTSSAVILSSVIAILLWASFFYLGYYIFSVLKFLFGFSMYHLFLYWGFLFFYLFQVCNCLLEHFHYYSFFKILVRLFQHLCHLSVVSADYLLSFELRFSWFFFFFF